VDTASFVFLSAHYRTVHIVISCRNFCRLAWDLEGVASLYRSIATYDVPVSSCKMLL